MSLIQQLTPSNLLEEKEVFLADQNYNPQFRYEDPVSKDKLAKYGHTSTAMAELAQSILDKTYFGRNEQDLVALQGPLVPHKDVTEKVSSFLALHNLQDRYKIVWSSSFVSRATISSDTIKLRSTSEFRTEDLLGMLYHEIGTHAIRRINYEQQPWFKKKNKLGFSNYLMTEEGIASLHSLLPKTFQMAYSSAIRYVAVSYAQTHTFAELWKYLGKYIQDDETRWMVTFRQKRGVADTSQGGGFTKDLVYFEGLVRVWKWLSQHNYDITPLYFGKMALEDVFAATEMNPDFKPLLPSFFEAQPEKYAQIAENIGKENGFDQVELE